MRYKSRQSFVIAILLTANLFSVACHERPREAPKQIDSLNTNPSTVFNKVGDTTIINQGKVLFRINCGSCHAIWKTDNYLEGIVERVGVKYLKLYLTKQDSLIEAKDKYALEIKKSFGNSRNSHNFPFSDEQLNAIIAYLEKYSN